MEKEVKAIKDLDYYKDYAIGLLEQYVPKVILALVVLIVGFWIVNRLVKFVRNVMEKRKLDPSLVPFLSSALSIVLKVALLISVISMLGVATSSFVALVGAMGLAFGLALQGSLANLAGGVLILIFKPFKVGDVIESEGIVGEVKVINVVSTELETLLGNTAIMPNGALAHAKVINFSKDRNRRIDLSIGIAYDEDISKAEDVIRQALLKVEGVLHDPSPFVGVLDFGDSAVNLAVRPYCKSPDYWDVYFKANKATKEALDAAGIAIPFPQTEVVIKKEL